MPVHALIRSRRLALAAGGVRPVDDSSGRQAKEIVVSLGVPGRAHGECPDGARRHTVLLLVSLNVLPELVLAVSVEMDCLSSDDGAWTKSFGHTVGVRGCVQRVCGMLGHFDDDSGRHVVEQ
jgi:hypothetical protein